jgi:hypothetical protein
MATCSHELRSWSEATKRLLIFPRAKLAEKLISHGGRLNPRMEFVATATVQFKVVVPSTIHQVDFEIPGNTETIFPTRSIPGFRPRALQNICRYFSRFFSTFGQFTVNLVCVCHEVGEAFALGCKMGEDGIQ